MTSHKTDMIKEIFDLARFISSNQSDSNLTMIQLRTVMFIKNKGIVKPTEIAKQFSITPASVTSQIDNLVREGWIERKYNQSDKRVIEVALTSKGENWLPGEVKKLKEFCEPVFQVLNQKEQEILLALVLKINKAIKN